MLVEPSPERLDPWVTRKAIALTFEYLAEDLPKDEIVPLFSFLLRDDALGDRNPDVRRGMLNVGTTVIDFHGKSHLPDLLSMFEHHLALKVSSSEAADYIREALVILLGRLAKHLDSADARVPLTVDRLVEALRTPSEVVQSAVAECLSPLVVPMGNKIGQLMERLLQALTTSPKYAERRGAAYGLAGVIHGLGISGLKEFAVIAQLQAAMEDKKNYEARQGALFAFETMSGTLGRLFEPYIPRVLPLLLAAYGDQTPDVREATQDASRVIMGNMSGYCLKLILPSLLGGLEEKQWRTKKGSIELLGAMSFLAPNQLSVSLPTVIPRLTSVLTDSHAQVRSAANKSLKQFGEVINNPEIRSLVPVLLKALVDPEKTLSALTALLKRSFAHYIDSPSLALVSS
jgi:HEAT-like repeat